MKYCPSVETVISTSKSTECGFEVNGKSFSLLTDGIYKNIIKAVVREYSTNASDAHIEADVNIPFEVHLPTEKECYFYIRDYGFGLTDEEIANVYCNLFKSTKDNSNLFNGQLGIGAFSALGLDSKSFTVESWNGGFHYIYNIFIGRKGVPEYTELLKEYSQERSGIKVQFSVKQSQIQEYEENAKEVYKYFERQPKFIGKQIKIDSVYGKRVRNYALNDDGAIAVMGNVAYPIDDNYSLRNVAESNLVLFFDIGEVTFTPSRESLKYTDRTIKNIKAKYKEIVESITEDITKEINSCKTEWEAIAKFHWVWSEYQNSIINLNKPSKLIWQNKEINTGEVKAEVDRFNSSYKKRRSETSFIIRKDYKYVVNDLNPGAYSRCQILANQSHTNVYLINQEVIDDLTIDFPKGLFIKASELPKPPTNTKTRSKLGSFRLMRDTYYVTDSWQEVDIKDATSKYYVIRKSYRAIYNGNPIRPQQLYKYARNAGINDSVYGIIPKEEKNIQKLGFIHIETAIEEKMKKIQGDIQKELDFLGKYQTYRSFRSNNKIFSNLQKVLKKHALKGSEVNQLLEIEEILKKDRQKYENLVDKINKMATIGKSCEIKQLPNLLDPYRKILEKYKLLNSVEFGGYYNRGITEELLYYYIIGVDNVCGNV